MWNIKSLKTNQNRQQCVSCFVPAILDHLIKKSNCLPAVITHSDRSSARDMCSHENHENAICSVDASALHLLKSFETQILLCGVAVAERRKSSQNITEVIRLQI